MGLNAKGCQNLEEIATVKLIFDLALKLKTDVYFLDALSNTTNLAASSANWPTYQSTASKMLLTLQSSSNPNDQTTLKQVNSTIEDKKRDALLWISISVLSNTWSDITTPDNLYEFPMIDPENSGCSEISLIKRGFECRTNVSATLPLESRKRSIHHKCRYSKRMVGMDDELPRFGRPIVKFFSTLKTI